MGKKPRADPASKGKEESKDFPKGKHYDQCTHSFHEEFYNASSSPVFSGVDETQSSELSVSKFFAQHGRDKWNWEDPDEEQQSSSLSF